MTDTTPQETPDIRWQQRFQNFDSAFAVLTEAMTVEAPSRLEQMGQIQVFEFTFELAWKVLKDYLNARRVPVGYPREVLKEAFRYELVSAGEVWLDMLEQRNLLAHTYKEERAEKAARLLREAYYPAIQELHMTFTILLNQ
jgi:nucleotidyltransferase substrate binding protein (TIGR01987 family)